MLWVYEKQNEIYTIIKTRVTNRLVVTYPTIRFTMTDGDNTEAVFPSVYIHFNSSDEVGADLDNTSVHAVTSSLDFSVSVNSAMGASSAQNIASEVITALKELRFTVRPIPELDNSVSDTWRMVGRARRTICESEALI